MAVPLSRDTDDLRMQLSAMPSDTKIGMNKCGVVVQYGGLDYCLHPQQSVRACNFILNRELTGEIVEMPSTVFIVASCRIEAPCSRGDCGASGRIDVVARVRSSFRLSRIRRQRSDMLTERPERGRQHRVKVRLRCVRVEVQCRLSPRDVVVRVVLDHGASPAHGDTLVRRPEFELERCMASGLHPRTNVVATRLEKHRQYNRHRDVGRHVGEGMQRVFERGEQCLRVARRARQQAAHLFDHFAAPAQARLLSAHQMRHHVFERHGHTVAIPGVHRTRTLPGHRLLRLGDTPLRPTTNVVVDALGAGPASQLVAAHDNAVNDACPGGNGDASWHIAEPSRKVARRARRACRRRRNRGGEIAMASADEAVREAVHLTP